MKAENEGLKEELEKISNRYKAKLREEVSLGSSLAPGHGDDVRLARFEAEMYVKAAGEKLSKEQVRSILYEPETVKRERDEMKRAMDAAVESRDEMRLELEKMRVEYDEMKALSKPGIEMREELEETCARLLKLRDVEKEFKTAQRRLVEVIPHLSLLMTS